MKNRSKLIGIILIVCGITWIAAGTIGCQAHERFCHNIEPASFCICTAACNIF